MHIRIDGNAIARYVGWATFQLSVMLIFLESNAWAPISNTHTTTGGLYFAMQIAYSLSFLLFAVLAMKTRFIFHSRVIATGIAVSLMASAVLLLPAQLFHGSIPFIGASFVGFSQALLFVAWQQQIAKEPILNAGCLILFACMMSAAVYLVFTLIFPGQFYLPIAFIASCLSLCAYVVDGHISKKASSTDREIGDREGGDTDYTETLVPRKSFNLIVQNLWRSILCVGFLGFTWEFIAEFGTHDPSMTILFQILPSANLVAIVILLVVWLKFYEKIDFVVLYQVIFPIVATAFLFLPFASYPLNLILVALSSAFFCVASVTMQVTCIQFSKRYKINTTVIIGIFAGVVYLLMTCGFAVGRSVFSSAHGTMELLIIAMLSVYACTIILFALRVGHRKEGERSGRRHSDVKPSFQTESANGFADEKSLLANMGEVQFEDQLVTRCKELADKYGLTAREQEVLLLLARGRNLPYISEKLFVSKNTIRSHSKSIYTKLNIHTKQELMDLVDC